MVVVEKMFPTSKKWWTNAREQENQLLHVSKFIIIKSEPASIYGSHGPWLWFAGLMFMNK